MKIAIVGYGLQGRSAYDYWRSPDNQLTICDANPATQAPNDTEKHFGSDYLQDLENYDLIIRSPGIHPRQLIEANSPNVMARVTSVSNEFFRVCPSKNIIGVTGTKGKGTTCTLIAQMLQAAGLTVHLGGNIGTPPLDMLKDIGADDWVVLELANFQLVDLGYAPKIGVCLMVAAEHLDWHADLSQYIAAKQQLFSRQTPADTAIYYARNDLSKTVASAGQGRKLSYFQAPGAEVIDDNILIERQTICKTDELAMLGEHNWQNACAAVTAVWQISRDVPAIKNVLTNFSGLKHRLEFVRELAGVSYYDDSFATTPEATVAATRAFNSPPVLILGGSDKDSDYRPLIRLVDEQNVRQVIAIGLMGPKIADQLRASGFSAITTGGQTMDQIVAQAQTAARPGDVVLLSTACASFDMFDNYVARGEAFQKAVHHLN
ncbi:MAG: UDP-N-acetylmuramoyl-L-alanine--D-glutamate ligase [Candidatus Saccharimonadales bacterium]